jgi:hypothetical protein
LRVFRTKFRQAGPNPAPTAVLKALPSDETIATTLMDMVRLVTSNEEATKGENEDFVACVLWNFRLRFLSGNLNNLNINSSFKKTFCDLRTRDSCERISIHKFDGRCWPVHEIFGQGVIGRRLEQQHFEVAHIMTPTQPLIHLIA